MTAWYYECKKDNKKRAWMAATKKTRKPAGEIPSNYEIEKAIEQLIRMIATKEAIKIESKSKEAGE